MAAEKYRDQLQELDDYKYGFADPEKYVFKARKGLSREVVEQISWMKGEPDWMLQFRLNAYQHFVKRPMPNWGPDLSGLDFDDIYYYIKPTDRQQTSWDDVPADIKRTFDRLGVPEAERKFLAGAGAQYECLSGDARVFTVRGMVPIRDVQAGDIVFSFDEETNQLIPSKVKAVVLKGEREVFQVRVGTRTIKVTADHPFLILDYRRHPDKLWGHYYRVWKYLSQLRPGIPVAVATSLPAAGQSYDYDGRYKTTLHKHDTEFVGFARINEIIPAGVEPVYDIEVEGPHNFVAEGLVVHNSEVVYHNIQESLAKQGVIFLSIENGLKEHPDLFKQYFGTIVPPNDNKFAALNSAVWSGGSFVYVPPGVQVALPLQAYFRINAQSMGQFERTLIIADEGSYVHYIEGCTAPLYTSDSFHSGVIEIIVRRGARMRYSTIQNWSNNVYNLVTQRSAVYGDATMEWVDANMGSRLTMKYPACFLMEPGAKGEILSIAFAGKGQHQDAGGKVVHTAPHTRSKITSKSISKDGGRSSYRGLLKVYKGAQGAQSHVQCDALLLDEHSRTDTYPYIEVDEDQVTIGHEATVSKIGDDQLFYLMSRGLNEVNARTMVVSGFIEPLVKELPMEYAVEMNRLIQLQMEGSVG